MSPPAAPAVLFFLAVLSFSSLPSSVASPLSTVAISHVFNQTVVCALVPSTGGGDDSRYTLNCTSLPLGVRESYPSGVVSYSAIAAGNGFLCALTSPPASGLATMRWWNLSEEKPGVEPKPKRIYQGGPLAELGAGDSHVCGLRAGTREVYCWRWPEFPSLEGESLTGIAVGGKFVCGLSTQNGTIRCFGSDSNVVGRQPGGGFTVVAAGACHACAVSTNGTVVCWGLGAPKVWGLPFEFVSLALGDNRTCALRNNGTVECWGEDLSLPDNLRQQEFLSIQAKGSSFCGVLVANYSLVCWGSEIFTKKPVVFSRVLPGPCSAPASCRCGILADSGNICSGGDGICATCGIPVESGPTSPLPPPPSNSTGSDHRRHGEGRRRSILFIVLGSVGLGLGVAAASCYLYLRFCKGSRCGQVHDSGRLDQLEAQPPGLPAARSRAAVDPVSVHQRLEFLRKGHSSTIEEFPLQVLLEVTDGFSEGHRIGSGSFGVVYRATLDDGREVAIKRAELCSSSLYPAAACTKRQEDKEQAFLSELAMLSRVNHKNLVRLLGFCTEGGERVLVYEYMPNGTLHDHLHKHPRGSPLASWHARLLVALDAARGIEYLHRYAVPPIIHRDIKSSNILLDDVWTAKVSDFGLSLMGPEDDASHLSLRAAGTVGYMDPEYYRLQYLTAKSDVYSFGVVLLELLTGFKAIHQQESGCDDEGSAPRNVVDFAVPRIDADQVHTLLDPKLPPPRPCEIEAVQYLGYLAADSVRPEGRDRPTMSEIVSTLERAVASCSVPPPLSRSMTTRSV